MSEASKSEPSAGDSAGRRLLYAWAARHGEAAPGSIQTVVFLRGTRGLQLVAAQPADQAAPPWLAGIASRAMANGEAVVISRHAEESRPVQAIAHPLRQQGALVGAVVVLRDGRSAATPPQMQALADSAAALPELLRAAASEQQRAREPDRLVIGWLEKIRNAATAKDAAEMLALALAGQLACERVSIGLRKDLATWLLAESGAAATRSRRQAASETAAAMDEAADQALTLVYPADPQRRLCLLTAHAQLSDKTRCPHLCTVPLAARGQIVGAVLAERRGAGPFSAEEVALIEKLAAAVGPLLHLMQQDEMPWRRRLVLALAAGWRNAGIGPRRVAAAAAAALLASVLAWPVEREVSAPVKLEGSVQRIIAAPGDVFLEKVHVRPGDSVKEGQLLLEFSAEDLRAERRRLMAEVAVREAAAADAMAKQDLATLGVEAAKVRESKAQLELLELRLARLRVVAPFDAVVIQGDLSNALGAPARKGDALMTLASAGSYRAIVEVDEGAIGEVRAGQAAAMVLTAMPYRTWPASVKGVNPLVATAQGRSYFEVELELRTQEMGTHDLRPGMRGIARLAGARRALGMAWLEQAATGCRLAWWRWVG